MNQISIQQQQGYTQKLRKIESEAGSVIGFNDEGQIDAITRTYDMGVVGGGVECGFRYGRCSL